MVIDKTYAKAYYARMTTISVSQARKDLYGLIDEVAASGKKVGITKKGETKAILVSQEEWDATQVTIETLSDPELMEQIRESEEDIKAGRFITLEELEKELDTDRSKNVSGKVNKSSRKRIQKAR